MLFLKVSESHLSPELGVFALAALFFPDCDQLEEIEEDQQVGCEEADADEGEAAEDFEDLPGEEGGGDGEGHVLGPDLFKIESDALDHADGGVAEGDQADAAQEGSLSSSSFVEDEVDQAGFGIEAEVVGEGSEFVADILMEQVARAKPDGDKKKRLEELVGGNEHEPLLWWRLLAKMCKWGADHYPWGILNNHCASSYVK